MIEPQAALTALNAVGNSDWALITQTTATPRRGYLQYGTATGVYTVNIKPDILGTAEKQSDGTIQYRMTWNLPGFQLAAAQSYFAIVTYTDQAGGATTEITWSQPGLNASASDTVIFDNRNFPRLAQIAELAGRA